MSTNTANSAPPTTTPSNLERFFCSICDLSYKVAPGGAAETCPRCGHMVCRQCLSYTRLTNVVMGLGFEIEDDLMFRWVGFRD
jgi:hypothetical protein